MIMAAFCPSVADAQEFSGQAVASDGDTINMTGTRIRLQGIDAPEAKQTCERAGVAWQCGEASTRALATLIAGKQVRCIQHATDRYGRPVATCSVGSMDLGEVQVSSGMAIVDLPNGELYLEREEQARAWRLGIWDSVFVNPAEFRAANPEVVAPAPRYAQARNAEVRQPAQSAPSSSVYYRNCAAARAAGAAPLRRGQPGYRPEMDGDGDGVACEPWHGRP